MKPFFFAALFALTSPAYADTVISYAFNGSFDDATFGVESAIVGRGLVIDHVSHTGQMLERTRADMGSDVVLFTNADVFLFCSASISRAVMEADPSNIAFCPYSVYVAEKDDAVTIGYRTYPEGPMQQVQALLDQIAREASEN